MVSVRQRNQKTNCFVDLFHVFLMNSEKAFKVLDYFHKNMNLAIYSKKFEWIEELAFDVLIKNPPQQQSRGTCENAFSPLFSRLFMVPHTCSYDQKSILQWTNKRDPKNILSGQIFNVFEVRSGSF